MNEVPRDEFVDSYSADEKWVRNEIFGDNPMLVYLLAWPISFVIFLVWPIIAIAIYIFLWCVVRIYGKKDVEKEFGKFILRKVVTTEILAVTFCLLDQITFGEIDRISKKSRSLALKYHEYKREMYSFE